MEVMNCKKKLANNKFSEVLKDFVNNISKSRNRDFHSKKLKKGGGRGEEGGGAHVSYQGGGTFEWGWWWWKYLRGDDTMVIMIKGEIFFIILFRYKR